MGRVPGAAHRRTPATSSRARACRSSTPTTAAACCTIPETLKKAHNGIKNVDTIINGHSTTQTTWADLKEFADFNQDFLTWAQAELKAGKTPEQAAAEWKVPEKYTGYSSQVADALRRPAGTHPAAAGGDGTEDRDRANFQLSTFNSEEFFKVWS